MNRFKQWWHNPLPVGVKFVFLVLLANAVPAITILMSIPHLTEDFFVWTINPVINARLMGVMYANALILISIGVFQTSWARVRIIMVVITLFSILATLLTFVYLKPFLAHPWFHLTYWLGMYLVLFFAAPYVFITQEKKEGGRLPINTPLTIPARLFAGALMLFNLICAFALLFRIETVNELLPWTLPPLVGGLIGVLFTTHTIAYGWALWDGDWVRVRPLFWQAPLTGLLFILLPLLHPNDLNADMGSALSRYYIIFGLIVLGGVAVVLSYRSTEKGLQHDG